MLSINHHVSPKDLMRDDTINDFTGIYKDLGVSERVNFENVLRKGKEAAEKVSKHWDFTAPAQAVDIVINQLLAPKSNEEKQRLRRAFVAKSCLDQAGMHAQRMPDSVLSLYPEFYARIAGYLKLFENYTYDDYSKDVRYALNLTVPAGLMEVDLQSRIGPKLVARNLKSAAGAMSMFSYLRHQSWGTWYSRHLDLRGKPDFSPNGWTDCLQRCADMLILNKSIRGVQGVSWYYDPALEQISPHLSYIRATQVKNGAFLIKIGPGEEYTRRATMKSQNRRRLVEAGKYLPTCYVLAWPREKLIDWAEKVRKDPSLGFK